MAGREGGKERDKRKRRRGEKRWKGGKGRGREGNKKYGSSLLVV